MGSLVVVSNSVMSVAKFKHIYKSQSFSSGTQENYLDQYCLLRNIGQFEIRQLVATVQRSQHHLSCSQNQVSNMNSNGIGLRKILKVSYQCISMVSKKALYIDSDSNHSVQ